MDLWLGFVIAAALTVWERLVPYTVGVIIALTVLRLAAPLALTGAFAFVVRRLDARMHRAAAV